jgi:hypothetical protein
MTTKVTLSSDAYGDETFEYDTIAEALSGIRRLPRSSKKQYAKDHIQREIKILIPQFEEE